MSETTASPAAGAWSYRGGEWFAVFGARVSILLPESQKDQVVALWALVDGGAGFDEVLDGLLAAGLSRVPGFVLVSTDDGPTRILLRGAGVRATLSAAEGEVSLDGGASHTWVERAVEGLTALQIDLPVADEVPSAGVDFPIATGLVRVGRINRPPAVAAVVAVPAVAPTAPPAEAGLLDDEGPATELMEAILDPVADPLTDPIPVAAPDALPAAAPDPLTDPLADPLTGPLPGSAPGAPGAPDDWVTPWDAPPAPLVEPDTPAVPPVGLPPLLDPVAAGADEPDQADEADQPDEPEEHEADTGGMTEVVPGSWPPPPTGAPVVDAPPLPIGSWEPIGGGFPPPPASPPGEPREAAPFDVDHDGATSSGAETEAAAPGATPGAGRAVATLLLSDGQTVVVEGAVLIGRAPEARRFTSTEQPLLVTVPSRLHEISSTHVEVRPGTGADHGSAVVTDMGSTNGTVLVQPGLGPEDLKPGIAVPLIPGAIINLGDGITIQVTRP